MSATTALYITLALCIVGAAITAALAVYTQRRVDRLEK